MPTAPRRSSLERLEEEEDAPFPGGNELWEALMKETEIQWLREPSSETLEELLLSVLSLILEKDLPSGDHLTSHVSSLSNHLSTLSLKSLIDNLFLYGDYFITALSTATGQTVEIHWIQDLRSRFKSALSEKSQDERIILIFLGWGQWLCGQIKSDCTMRPSPVTSPTQAATQVEPISASPIFEVPTENDPLRLKPGEHIREFPSKGSLLISAELWSLIKVDNLERMRKMKQRD